MAFPFYKQFDSMDCGPACLRMIAKYYGKSYSIETLRELCFIDREGVSLAGLSNAAETIHLKTQAVLISFEQLLQEVPLPCIVHWQQNHFVVVYKTNKEKIFIADPAVGLIDLSHQDFTNGWVSTVSKNTPEGVCFMLEPTVEFDLAEDEAIDKQSWNFLFRYLKNYKGLLLQLMIGLFVGSILQVIFPFLTQAVVDQGIQLQNLQFVYIVLIAQLVLFFSQMTVEMVRSWILLHISSRVNISLISDFLIKLMKLPISFFDTKVIGDLMQRIQDHYRIERFLTASTIGILFSFVNLFIFGIILLLYDKMIFAIFSLGSILYAAWILFFMNKRKNLDYKQFDQAAANQTKLIQLIQGMQEIKLTNSENIKRWEWERIQAKVFKLNVKSLQLSQVQELGGSFVNQFKNIFISFYTAKLVIQGELTLGMMMSVQYIIGQLSAPINQLLNFAQLMQDAKISIDRLGEIHNKQNEENIEDQKLKELPAQKNLTLKQVSFQYGGPDSHAVLKNINLVIPEGKVTAIVGTSGSGKTTLLKLLMKFYEPTAGEIALGDASFKNISIKKWRASISGVMQDSFLFSDSIANNITIGDERPNKQKLLEAVKKANIQSFIESLPLGYNTKIGAEGNGLSQGQKQRIFLARAIYKEPEFLFLDEATNSLDANNEQEIMRNLKDFFVGRTVIIVAHRLSTVKDADNIVVLEKGEMIEQGAHHELVNQKGAYYTLIKNQLELGS
jgi:ATP-binding cassette subfamily B protein